MPTVTPDAPQMRGSLDPNFAPCRILFPAPYEVELAPCETVPEDDLALEEVLLATRYSLISPGTELAFYTGTHNGLNDPANTWAKYPFEPGYAAVGEVEAIGDAVRGLARGQMIYAVAPHAAQSILKWSEDQPFLPVSENCPPAHAVFTRLAAIAATAAAVASAREGERVAVLGAGLIGNLAAQIYAASGADVTIVDPVEGRRDIARRCDLQACTSIESIADAPQLIIEATGVPALVNVALENVARRGRVVLLGSPRGLVEMDVYRHIHARGVQLLGAHEVLQGSDGLPTRLELSRQMLDWIATQRLHIAPLLTHVLPATQARDAYEMLLHARDEALGVLFDWRA